MFLVAPEQSGQHETLGLHPSCGTGHTVHWERADATAESGDSLTSQG